MKTCHDHDEERVHRYFREHTAIAVGLVAVLVMVIIAASK